MASPEELAPVLPDTLPEDFSDWDSETSPAATPVNSSEWEEWAGSHSFTKSPKQSWYSAERDAKSSLVEDRPRISGSALAAPAPIEQDKKPIESSREAGPTAPSSKREEWETWLALQSSEDAATRPGHSKKPEAVSAQTFDRPHDRTSASSAPAPLKSKKLGSDSTNKPLSQASERLEPNQRSNEVLVAPTQPDTDAADGASHSPEPKAASEGEANAVLFSSFSSKNIEEASKERQSGKKKWIIIGSVGVSAILISAGLLLPKFHHGLVFGVQEPVQQGASATDAGAGTETPKPMAGEPVTENEPPAGTEGQKTANDQANAEADKANLVQEQTREQARAQAKAQAQAQMMNDQLSAPAQIPKQVAESGPPPASLSAGAAGDLGGSGADSRIFNGQKQPVVKATLPKPITISSGVATGMLIQKASPTYPPIAISARVSGTVELHATITKAGTIKDLSVVSGPQMLRQAAIEAVRTWQYKPYMLNDQPTEVETTINVVFSLGG